MIDQSQISKLVRILNGEIFLVEEERGILDRGKSYEIKRYDLKKQVVKTLGYTTSKR